MVSNPLEGARAKLDRANYHLERLKHKIDSDRADDAYGISFSHETQTDEVVVRALMPRKLFIHYAIIAGEIVGQARSALEHAVWEMVPNPIEGRTGFPVFRLERDPAVRSQAKRNYERNGLRMIEGINPAAAAIIKAEQPFGADYQTNLLYVLNELWNRDKHRLLNFCIVYLQGIALLWGDWPVITPPAEVKDGTELYRGPHPDREVEMRAEVALSDIRFDGGFLDRQPVAELLARLIHFSQSIVDDLAKTI